MSGQLDVVEARLESLDQLGEVVGALRSLAGLRLRQAAQGLPAARRYAEIVAAALAQALALDRRPGDGGPEDGGPADDGPAPRPGRAGVVLFGSEHGFVGGFNAALLREAGAWEPRSRDTALFVIGARAHALALEAGLTPAWHLPGAARVDGVPTLARRLAAELYRRFASGGIGRLDVVFGRMGAVGQWSPARQTLLPLDLASFRVARQGGAPLVTLAPPELIAGLVEEYFLADLVQGALESLAAENAARLAAMSAADENIALRHDRLLTQARALRQEQVTAEMLDVVSGAEVLLHPRR